MERVFLKISLLVAFLLAASCIEGRKVTVEGTNSAGCVNPHDCVSQCHGCRQNICAGGVCVCGCTERQVSGFNGSTDQLQCIRPGDCVGRCHGCTVNKCTAGLCVCGC